MSGLGETKIVGQMKVCSKMSVQGQNRVRVGVSLGTGVKSWDVG